MSVSSSKSDADIVEVLSALRLLIRGPHVLPRATVVAKGWEEPHRRMSPLTNKDRMRYLSIQWLCNGICGSLEV